MTLSTQQLERQDLVDNAIFELLQKVNPTYESLSWNIEQIAEVRDLVVEIFSESLDDFDEQGFYPYFED